MADGSVIIDVIMRLEQAEKAIAGLPQKFESIGGKMKKAGNVLSIGVTAPLLLAGKAMLTLGNDFEAQMDRVQAIAGATGDDMKKLEQQALDLGASTKFSASQVAEGMEGLASAGFTTSEIMQSMPGMLDLAASSGADLATASDIAAAALRGFSLDASKSSHVADVFAAAAAKTNAQTEDLGEAMKFVAPVAGAMGISIEETAAAIGIMSDAGIKGSQAGTSLRGMLTLMTKQSKPAKEAMEALGVSFYDTQGKMKPLSQIIDEFSKKTAGLTEEQRNNAIVTIFGQEALSGVLALMNRGSGDLKRLTKEFKNSDGAAADMAKTMSDNTQGSIEEMNGALETAAITAQKALAPTIRDVAKWIGNLADKFSKLNPQTQKLILGFGAAAIAAGPVIRVLGSITSGAGSVINVAKKLIGHAAEGEKAATGLIGLFTKLAGANVATATTGAAAAATTGVVAGAMDVEAASATAATAATTAFNASLGLIAAGAIIAIAAAVAINNAIEAARYTTGEWAADTAEGFEKLSAAIEQSNGVMEIYVADTTAAGKSVSEAQDAIKAAEANLVAAYQQYMNDKAALRNKDLADIRRYNEEYIKALQDELSAYVAAQNLLSTKLKEGLLDVTGSNVADVLKSMAEARDQAIQAAKEQADAEATFWQSQFDQGEITKQQLTEQLNLLEKNKNASIEAARGAYAEQNYWAQKSFVENNKNLQKQLKNLEAYGQEVVDNTDWYNKRLQEIENTTYVTATGLQEAKNQLNAEMATKLGKVSEKVQAAWQAMSNESRAAWLQMLDAQTKGGYKLDAQTKSMVQGIIASLSTMGGSFEDIGEDSMVSLGRAILSAEDPKAAMTAQKSDCIKAFKSAYKEFQETGSGGVDAVAKGMTDKKDGAKKDAEKVGKAIAEGLDSGYKSIIQKVIKYVQDSMKIIQRAMLMAAEINSPSRLTRPVGEGLAEGVGVGFVEQMRKVRQQIQASAALELGRVQISALNLNGAGGGSNTYNISHTIQSSVPLSLREIRQEMLLAEQRNRLLMGV